MGLSLRLTLVNEGAKPAVVLLMSSTLHRSGSRAELLRWDRFEEPKGIETPESSGIRYEFAGYADCVVVPPRSAASKRVQFFGQHSYVFEAGDYELSVAAYIDPKAVAAATLTATFSVSDEQAAAWLNTAGQVGSGRSAGSLTLFLDSKQC